MQKNQNGRLLIKILLCAGGCLKYFMKENGSFACRQKMGMPPQQKIGCGGGEKDQIKNII